MNEKFEKCFHYDISYHEKMKINTNIKERISQYLQSISIDVVSMIGLNVLMYFLISKLMFPQISMLMLENDTSQVLINDIYIPVIIVELFIIGFYTKQNFYKVTRLRELLKARDDIDLFKTDKKTYCCEIPKEKSSSFILTDNHDDKVSLPLDIAKTSKIKNNNIVRLYKCEFSPLIIVLPEKEEDKNE